MGNPGSLGKRVGAQGEMDFDHSEGLDQPRERSREGTPSKLKLQAWCHTELCLPLTGKRKQEEENREQKKSVSVLGTFGDWMLSRMPGCIDSPDSRVTIHIKHLKP